MFADIAASLWRPLVCTCADITLTMHGTHTCVPCECDVHRMESQHAAEDVVRSVARNSLQHHAPQITAEPTRCAIREQKKGLGLPQKHACNSSGLGQLPPPKFRYCQLCSEHAVHSVGLLAYHVGWHNRLRVSHQAHMLLMGLGFEFCCRVWGLSSVPVPMPSRPYLHHV
jgi:hypothetical protein